MPKTPKQIGAEFVERMNQAETDIKANKAEMKAAKEAAKAAEKAEKKNSNTTA